MKNLYEELVANREAYEDNLKKYPVEAVERMVDELGVFDRPMAKVLEMSQDEYAENLSDGKFSFDFSGHQVSELLDRLIISHTDGSVREGNVSLAYRHEDPYESGQYNVKTDLNIVQYGLAVLSALAGVIPAEDLAKITSPDAAVSIWLATEAIKETGRG